MSFISWKNKTSTPGSPINSTLQNTGNNNNSNNLNNSSNGTPTNSNTSTPSSISGLGPLGSSSSAPTLQSTGGFTYTPSSAPMFNSASNLNSVSNSTGIQSPTLSSSTSSDYNNSTVGRANLIDTSQFNNNYTQFGGQPLVPHSDIGSAVLNKFSKYLLTKGYNFDGIFKPHPELENEIQTVKKNLLKDLSLDAEQLHIPTLTQNPYVIAELFKQYLSLLPEPLFSFHLYDSFLLTHSILSPLDRIWAYRFLLLYLPMGFRGAIKSVLTVLQKVHQCSDQTKMNSESLSKIFSSVFLRPEEQMYYMKSDQQTIEEIVKLWIEEYETISKPPTGPNSRVSTILSSIPPHPQQQAPNLQQFSTSQPPQTLQQPTIGLYKIAGSNSSNNLQSKSPKLSLPTIPKDDHQQVTIVKSKPVIQTIEPKKPIEQPKATQSQPISIPNNNNNISNNNNNNNSSTTPNSSPGSYRLSMLIPSSSSSSPSASTISPQEVEEKVNKIKISIDATVSEQTLLQVKNLLKSIEKDFNYNNIIKFSTILRDAKKHMNESAEKLLGLNKTIIREFIQEYPKPLSYNLLVSSTPILDNSALGDQEKKANDLKRASQVASDEISDYIYFFKLNVSTFENKEQVIATAQIFSKLKSILDSPGTSLSDLVANYNSTGTIDSSSPNSSPSLARFNNNFNNIPISPSSQVNNNNYNIDKSTARVIEVCTEEIKVKIDVKKNKVENADINQAFEIGKNIRIIKTTLDELYNECKLAFPPEVKAQSVPGEDQLSTLRKALPILFDRFKTQIDCLSQRILLNNCTSNEEQNLIMDKLLFINRHLKV
ncbi:hypothetical protein DICPUDRAFT_88032 [Dictyostelium purpureum]|uniref:Rho-GAP domain-containing protein n=1 Tax=Dictyostelium purpureum TaxID=5786 RepID=F0ZLW9_DICPU|nr:uncharacterized protein DICPUDRAFT_88032 [Dictyostelium purpureum]EGC35040.1 hypothetical protein DICPUDRAFT_88032 [Dictyostelium purpureum]|eukprot:XP_003288408.1 hypothetical protein DICPUDRAFT_88032 [Dictyostelium purpureum]